MPFIDYGAESRPEGRWAGGGTQSHPVCHLTVSRTEEAVLQEAELGAEPGLLCHGQPAALGMRAGQLDKEGLVP
jgi:hypothetical protein